MYTQTLAAASTDVFRTLWEPQDYTSASEKTFTFEDLATLLDSANPNLGPLHHALRRPILDCFASEEYSEIVEIVRKTATEMGLDYSFTVIELIITARRENRAAQELGAIAEPLGLKVAEAETENLPRPEGMS